MAIPDWNNDLNTPAKAWSLCSPTKASMDKEAQARHHTSGKQIETGATIANSGKP